jgi:phage-related protein (TIGR01555 family)
LPGPVDQPAPPTIGKGGLRYIHVLHRHQITLGDQNRDIESPYFQQPEFFQIANDVRNARIHPSRVIALTGNHVPEDTAGGDDWYWGDPLLMAVRDALVAHDTTTGSIAALLQEAKIDVIHIPGLMDDLTSSDYEQQLIGRLNVAALLKSLTNTLILDGGDGKEGNGETWETRQLTWTGLPDIQRTMFQLVAGAADIPATRLIGQAPVGMNATGDSDTRNYYDMLSSEQESELTPTLAPLDAYLIQSATGGLDPAIYSEWNPLWQMTPKEKADRDYLVAQTAEKYSGIGAVPGDALAVAIQNRLIEDAVFPGLEAAIEEAELEADLSMPPAEVPPALDPNAPPVPPPANENPISGNSRRRAANDRARKRIRRQGMLDRIADATPRPLYVSRKVLNGAEIVAWARSQGFKNILAPTDMHVTVTASRDAVDWLKVGGDSWSSGDGSIEVAPGGPRVVEPLGMAVVLLFNSSDLTWRHDAMVERGASWDFSEYQPHISISYDREANADLDLASVEPYAGAIRLGPEMFEEFKPDPII